MLDNLVVKMFFAVSLKYLLFRSHHQNRICHGLAWLHEAVISRLSLMVVLGEVGVTSSRRSDDDDIGGQP